MTIGLFQVDPFPDPIHAGQEIENVGVLFAHILIVIFLILLMIYFYIKIKKELPIIVIYLFSLVIGIACLGNSFMPFAPYFSIFFLIFQTSIFIQFALENYNII